MGIQAQFIVVQAKPLLQQGKEVEVVTLKLPKMLHLSFVQLYAERFLKQRHRFVQIRPPGARTDGGLDGKEG